jgi:CO/xanthine dehydrogenase Mo-binding subunit
MSIMDRDETGLGDDVEVFEGSGLTRGTFLKAGGALVIGLALPFAGTTAEADASTSSPTQVPTLVPLAPTGISPVALSSYLTVNSDGTVTAYTGKVDLGQGNSTAISQVIAEELYLTIDKIKLIMGNTDLCINQGYTAGSTTMQTMWTSMRPAAAYGYQTLLSLASTQLGVPVANLTASGGVISDSTNPANKISYGALVGGKVFTEVVPFTSSKTSTGVTTTLNVPNMKPISEYTVVGTSQPRIDIPPKVTADYQYVHDVRVPGMLHGRVVRPPAIGAQLVTVGSVPEGVQLVRIKNFLAVAHEDEWTAIQAAENLETSWTEWKGLPKQGDLFEYIFNSPEIPNSPSLVTASADASSQATLGAIAAPPKLTMAQAQANVQTALASAAKTLSVGYDTPIETHGTMGPSCAVVSYLPEQTVVWSGSQGPSGVQTAVASVLGIDPSLVHVRALPAAGCYGRNGADLVCVDAALMSQALGVPVRVQWSRADEHVWDPKGPATIHQMQGGIDADGNVVAYYHEGWLAGAQYDTTIIGAVLAGKSAYSLGGGAWSTAYQTYTFPNLAVVAHSQPDLATAQNQGLGVYSAWLRSPAQFQVTFAHESFVDELAALAGVDPIQFRLKYLTDERYISVLQHVAQMANWETRPSPSGDSSSNKTVVTGRGVGMALRDGTYAGNVAEVEVNRSTGKIRVTKVWGAQDCGLAVNPRAIVLGAEGAITQGVSRVLMEECTFNQSIFTSNDWITYPVIRMDEAPDIEFDVINNPAFVMNGSGEPPMTPTAAAVNNAVFDAIGVRLRSMPLKPHKVVAALKEADRWIKPVKTKKA